MSADKSTVKNLHADHGDFKEIESSRAPFDTDIKWNFKRTVKPDWKFGNGANDNGASLKIPHVEIDPYEKGRPANFNYKLLISGIVPRPIGLISTIAKDGKSTNLAPFSYYQLVNSDPPMFVVGFSGGLDNPKDSLKNLLESGEAVINIVSEHYIEAANATSVNAPYGVSEWALSGLTPAPATVVKASRVKEAILSVECKLESTKEFESKAKPGKKSGVLAILEGVRFWVREDAINEERNLIDPAVRLLMFYKHVLHILNSLGPQTHRSCRWNYLRKSNGRLGAYETRLRGDSGE